MKKQYQTPKAITTSFSLNDAVMGAMLSTSVAGTDPIDVPIES